MIDVSEEGFATEVLDRSETMPVVVDFWAGWCGPCRALGPVLEEATKDRAVVLAKVDAEACPNLAAYYQVHGIPAVKVFRRREVVAQFVGARPAAYVAGFLDDLAPPELEELVAAGDEASLRRAVELDRRRADAAVALAEILHRRGEDAEALAVLKPAGGGFRADGLAARIRLEAAEDSELTAAFGALDAGETERGLDLLLDVLARTGDGEDSGAGGDPAAGPPAAEVRRAVVSVLDGLGFGHPLAAELRRRVAKPAS
ncbi:MAG: putative thioredoxin [Solirubrobacteraceae bacterium]|nr:putative thioredoxin [Solirubrobacteraceae bacterium]